MEKLNLFEIPLFKVSLSDWDSRKQVIMDHYNRCLPDMDVDADTGLLTNYFNGTKGMSYFVYDVFRNEISDFMDSLYSWHMNNDSCMRRNWDKFRYIYAINSAWFQLQESHQSHGLHCHGQQGFSAVCYINLEEDHKITEFVAPFFDFDNGMYQFAIPPVEEGDVIFFPSYVGHYTIAQPNIKNRLILSFNIQPMVTPNTEYCVPIIGDYYSIALRDCGDD